MADQDEHNREKHVYMEGEALLLHGRLTELERIEAERKAREEATKKKRAITKIDSLRLPLSN